ncbi:4-alpha-glucanotransferase [Pseudoalteromonas shioyasakiensis]|uniref:4-alpha-glucanotransferase n=1 Tax=Pseudoalteromonas shioyasakiensis TaxID=1190813 RepID=UPI00211876D7|nr:4-alpha-glucanotransferase [Pseudoalteromonas shioyasakiensis]MCQ8880373.1 4-alpha-glucanotransferase [Pseudoalteromonas shioyasakiensis]
MQSLSQLYYLHGIGYEYTKYTGEHVIFDESTRKQALSCCGIDTQDEDAIKQLNFALDAGTWLNLLPQTSIVEAHQPILKVRLDERLLSRSCTLSVPSLNICFTRENLQGLEVLGDYGLNGIRYLELALPVPDMPIGYHDALISVADQQSHSQLWVVPKECFSIDDKKRLGLSIQLYSLCNEDGLGIGDFADLEKLIQEAAAQNMDYVLLNPLHLLFEHSPERASPYSPNSRALLNPLYIAVSQCEDAKNNKALTKLLADKPQPNSSYIDYTSVSEFKYQVFSCLYQHFCEFASPDRKEQFAIFCDTHKRSLSTMLVGDRDYASYLQWQAHSQLNICQQAARDSGMAIGLINDLAVGCAGDGSEFKSQNELFAEGAHVGAPPDPWAEHGQNWGLPALNPQKLSKDNFAFYRSLIRANMEDVGGLRIDHVMAIRRLWWCFKNNSQQDGCYVYYPFEHLLAVLKIESHLNQCVVIGEDLGVVPNEVREALKASAIYSNGLFYFEKDYQGEFLAAEHFAPQSLLMIANHDVPPFKGWWIGHDITIKQQYGLLDEGQARALFDARNLEKQRMLNFIARESEQYLSLDADAFLVYEALASSLAAAPARLFTIQIDDLDQQVLPVNIPGTDKEYPNWRRLLSRPAAEIIKAQQSFLANLISIRNQ